MPSKDDKQTLEMIKLIEVKQKEIQQLEKPNWKTNCNLSFIEGASKGLNLHVCSDSNLLAKGLGFLMMQESFYKMACSELDMPAPKFTWDGYLLEDWKHDFALRINKLSIDTKKKKLAQLEARLDKIISPALKQKLELDAIAKELEDE